MASLYFPSLKEAIGYSPDSAWPALSVTRVSRTLPLLSQRANSTPFIGFLVSLSVLFKMIFFPLPGHLPSSQTDFTCIFDFKRHFTGNDISLWCSFFQKCVFSNRQFFQIVRFLTGCPAFHHLIIFIQDIKFCSSTSELPSVISSLLISTFVTSSFISTFWTSAVFSTVKVMLSAVT